jgi:predicted DNA-binding transcriptional regulator YafY
MATNKHAQIRYQALDKCFRNFGRKYFIDDLVEACNKAIYDYSGKDDGVKKRQIYEDINYMESEQGWSINLEKIKDGRKVYFRYEDKNFSINKQPVNDAEVDQINEVLLTLGRFKGMPQFEWIGEISSRLKLISSRQMNFNVIEFEQNQYLKGLEFITPLFNAIINKRVLKIKYLPFKDEKELEYIVHPYYLKQYNLRWFLFAWNNEKEFLMNIALDRIVAVKEISKPFIENTTIDFAEYFEDIIGVTIPENKTVDTIRIQIAESLWPYIKTKPLHGTQKLIKKENSAVEIELQLIINYELISLLLSFGDKIKITTPQSLIDVLKSTVNSTIRNYK